VDNNRISGIEKVKSNMVLLAKARDQIKPLREFVFRGKWKEPSPFALKG